MLLAWLVDNTAKQCIVFKIERTVEVSDWILNAVFENYLPKYIQQMSSATLIIDYFQVCR